jgi:hypothetical protein
MSRLRERKGESATPAKVAECLARVAEAESASGRTIRPETQEAYKELARSWQQLATCWMRIGSDPVNRASDHDARE